ncbi:OLC1v1035726C1 [Oldenlandia corymbosa var. corymbosa]|uniref:OLC1v1035726C1 n=1 Tax=Oldenlandia corymbosa var. corymbosa TaxID=529605 RepID=A0AAV1CWT7_OLDCO|nr:OLC1v1035726C1 [Oldenlandia corymbosa var. corymbosa]
MSRRRFLERFLPLFLLLLLLLGNESYGSRVTKSKTGGSSVFSLFNLREKSRFWSESVLRTDFADLESSRPEKEQAANYTKAGTISHYLKLFEVDSMYLPVPVNFIFIGFEGKGNQEFKLQAEELERWFTKIDHIFQHSRIPQIGEVLTPFYKISIDREQRHHLPLVSHINYNFSVHAIELGEKVTSIFEHAIDVFGRKNDVQDTREDGLWQVDVDMMGALFTSLVEYLQLEDAYNIFVLNPKLDVKKAKYGYRRGLSESEINFLKENKALQSKILQSGSVPESVLGLDKIKRPLYEKHPMAKFSWTVTEDTDTAEWYNRCLDALNVIERQYTGKDTAYIIQSKVLQSLSGKNEDLKLSFEKDLKTGEFNGLHAECLTDMWIGKERWAFIDLTAGPFSWGPAVGGEGVRTELSLPNVEKTVGAVSEISEDEAEDRLQEAIQEKFSVFGDKDHHAIDILLAEIDIYELFAFKHCKGRRVKLALCEELDERMEDLKAELKSFEGEEYDESHKRKAIDALKRMESWNLFSDTYEGSGNYTVARDSFLAHLGATLWGSMRHVISPSLADGAFHYYEKISFQLFFITQERVRNIKQLPIDLKSLQNSLSSLVLPSQKVMFSQHMLPLSEDPALAMAFSVARRAAAVPLLLVNGTYRKTVRTYLDSSILQHQLKRLNEHGSLKGSHAHSRSTLEVPIFWFIHGDPLLVDQHYQSKALSDMVIVVQSEESSWESHLQCNGQSLLLDLRRPIKAATASVSEHLAGLLPLHLVYSQAHESATEDWIWSVGCSPLSITSHGWHISQFQSDSIARSYILTALEESVQIVNSAIRRLAVERTSDQTFKVFQSMERELVNKYNYVVSLWRRIATISGELRYDNAMGILYTLEDASKGFSDLVNTTLASLHPIHCTRQRKVEVEYDMTTVPAFFVVFIILFLVLRPRRPKPKIN